MSREFAFTFGGELVQANADEHPNQMKFSGVLVRLDEPSTRPPNGAEGHKILVPSSVAKKRLDTLIGMGINYDPDLDTHAQRRKVGVINKAWIKGKDLWVEGTIWKHDFPEATKDLKRSGLGMSMEINRVEVEDPDAPVWRITDLCFLGATVLYKDKAAYYHTQAIAARAQERTRTHMAVKTRPGTKKVANATIDFGQMAEDAVKRAVAPIEASNESLLRAINAQTEVLAQLAGALESLEVGASTNEKMEVGANKDCVVKAKEKEEDDDEDDDDEDEEDMESSVDTDVDEGELEEMGPETEDVEDKDDETGQLNKAAKNHGDKTTTEDKVGKTVASSQVKALRKQVATLMAQLAKKDKDVKELAREQSRLTKQVTAAAEDTNRRSIPVELTGLLAKADPASREIVASGQQLSVDQVDQVLAEIERNSGIGTFGSQKRIEIKQMLRQSGVMEDGVVDRGFSRLLR